MPRARRNRSAAGKSVEALRHEADTRTNIPTAEHQSMVEEETESPLRTAYQRRNRDLDPQLVWRGKDEQDLDDLVVNVPPLYIQEKVHPKVLIDDLLHQSRNGSQPSEYQVDMFSDFNGLPEGADRTEFYQHDGYWQNRMVLGDSLQVMASLAEREGLQGKVQCIYIDPPYGIRFNSNFQWSTTSRDVKDGNKAHITRESEQVKAYRDHWRDGVNTYLSYLRDRLLVAGALLSDSGSVFVQIGDENVHRVRALMDEVFGEKNFVSEILLKKGGTATSNYLPSTSDFILLYAKDISQLKYRQMYEAKTVGVGASTGERYDQVELDAGIRRSMTREEKINPSFIPSGARPFKHSNPCSQHDNPRHREQALKVNGREFFPPTDRQWSTSLDRMSRIERANRLIPTGRNLAYVMYSDDFPVVEVNNFWTNLLMRAIRQQGNTL